VRAFLAPAVIVLSFVLLAVLAIAASMVTGSGDPAHRVGRIWARIALRAAGVKVRVGGRGHIPRGEPVVFACNHASQFDIPVVYAALPVQFRFLVKKELFRIPLFGLAMRRTGYIPVDRAGGKAALRSLEEAAARIREGTSVVIFPEGTRSPDGRLRPFKAGGILLAVKAGCRVVPVAVSGSHRILPKGTLKVRSGEVRVGIGPAVNTVREGGRSRSKDDVAMDVWNAIAAMLEEENRPA